MSSYNVKEFVLEDFSSDTDGGEELPQMIDIDSPEHVTVVGGKDASSFDEDFSGTKKGKAQEDLSSSFETQFTTQHDINTLLENAKQEAADMIEAAKREVDRIEREAYEKGYQDGKEVGRNESREEGTQKLLPSVEAFENSLKELAACRSLTYRNCEAELIELFNTLSRKVIQRELGRSNEFILDVIREAMKEVTRQESITVRLNQEDLDYAVSFKEDLLAELVNIKSLSLEKDNSITRGGCVIETNFGEIDGRVETKISEIEKALLQKKPKKETYKTPERETEPGES